MQKKHAPGRIEACLSCKWMLREIGAFNAHLGSRSIVRDLGANLFPFGTIWLFERRRIELAFHCD